MGGRLPNVRWTISLIAHTAVSVSAGIFADTIGTSSQTEIRTRRVPSSTSDIAIRPASGPAAPIRGAAERAPCAALAAIALAR